MFVNTFTFLTLALKKSISLFACSKKMCVWNVLIWNCEYFKRLTIKGLEVSFYQKFTYFDLYSLNKSLKWFTGLGVKLAKNCHLMAYVNALNGFKESEKFIVGFLQIFFSDVVLNQLAVVALCLSPGFGERFFKILFQ